MFKTKFPQIIHVTQEKGSPSDEPWLEVHRRGVLDLDEPGQQVALYKRVKVGYVKILKSFSTQGGKRQSS